MQRNAVAIAIDKDTVEDTATLYTTLVDETKGDIINNEVVLQK